MKKIIIAHGLAGVSCGGNFGSTVVSVEGVNEFFQEGVYFTNDKLAGKTLTISAPCGMRLGKVQGKILNAQSVFDAKTKMVATEITVSLGRIPERMVLGESDFFRVENVARQERKPRKERKESRTLSHNPFAALKVG